MGAILSFIQKHTGILVAVEKAALHELPKLLQALYPQDPVIQEVCGKIIDELEKLQGIQQA
ncbi:MAG TPA: hypothetical protein PK443_04640 [bacterium]|nr:hypothetical protein [bacterium]